MKNQIGKRLLSWFMIVAMVLSVVQVGMPVKVSAAGETKLTTLATQAVVSESITVNGTPQTLSTYKISDVTLSGTIKSVSIQFTTVANGRYEGIEYTTADGFTVSSKTPLPTGGEMDAKHIVHLIINADSKTADEWTAMLKSNIRIKAFAGSRVMMEVSDLNDLGKTNLVEYYEKNGHYYELVDEHKSWTDARQDALDATTLSATDYDSYLVNVTSAEENDFLYSICRTTSWIGTACATDVTCSGETQTIGEKYGLASVNTDTDPGYWFYVDGPEKGKLMTYGTRQADSSSNTMSMAMKGETVTINGVNATGGYESGGNNWANYSNWLNNSQYDNALTDRTHTINEPNNTPNEYYMVIYSRDDAARSGYEWIIPSMWNDFSVDSNQVNSYIIEYSRKDGKKPNFSDSPTQIELKLGDAVTKDSTIHVINYAEMHPTTVGRKSGTKKYTVGETVTVENIKWGGSEGTTVTNTDVTFQWQYNDNGEWKDISGATTDTYVPGTELSGKNIRCVVTGILAKGYVGTVYVDGDTFNKSDSESCQGTGVIKPSITANDIIISKEDAVKETVSSLKTDTGAVITNILGDVYDGNNITTGDVDKVKAAGNGNGGDINVTWKHDNADDKTVTVHVMDEADSVTDGSGKTIFIGANNFNISVADVTKALEGDEAILKQLSNVLAIDGGVNAATAVIDVDDSYKSQLKSIPGQYPVTFTYNGVSVTVTATVRSNGNSDSVKDNDNNNNNEADEVITGNDFSVAGGSGSLNPEDIIAKGNVEAADGNGMPIVLTPGSSVNSDDLAKLNEAVSNGKKGIYPVEVSTPNNTTTTIYVTVTDENNDTKNDSTKTGETISANNFKIGINDYERIFGNADTKNANVTKLSNAKAYLSDLKTPVEIIYIDTSQVANAAGTYPVTLTTAAGTTTTVKVTIDDTWDTIGDIEKASEANISDDTVDNSTAKKKEENVSSDAGQKIGSPVNPLNIVYEKTNPQDKTEPIDPTKKVPAAGALTVDGVAVDQYTINEDGTLLIISKDYLNSLPNGVYQAVLTYEDGTQQQFSITIMDYDESAVVKNPPLFSMYKEIVLKKKNTFTINLKGITQYAVVNTEITGKGKKAKKVVSIKQKKNGDVVITPKKVGKSQVTCTIIQNGAEYKVVVDLKVLKEYKGTSKNYNLKSKGLVKTGGELPEFNVYKRIVKGKNTKIKFTKVANDADVKFYVANKKEAKYLKIGKIKRKGSTVTCTVKGKKKGWVHLTAEISQNGKTYYTRLLVRIDDGTWKAKQIKKYLK